MGVTNQLQATWIGSRAREAVNQRQSGVTLGTTRGGFYIQTTTKWLLFISKNRFRGPLTINLPLFSAARMDLAAGMAVEIGPERISIPGALAVIGLEAAGVWRPAAPRFPPGRDIARKQRIADLAARVFAQRPESDLSHLLPRWFIKSAFPSENIGPQQAVFEVLVGLVDEAISGKPFRSIAALETTLGLGRGLTPSGDDLILGLLLALNRRLNELEPRAEIFRLNRLAVEAAYQRTTTLSANLIECATLGLADERLMAGVDWLLSGTGDMETAANGFLNWGNHSGVAVMVGIGIAMLTQSE